MSQHPAPAGDASPSPLPPGTTHLVDLDGTMATKHANGKDVRDIVLIPRPSDDPEDPLNWSFRRKLLSTSCVVVYTMLLAIPSSAVYSVVTPIRKATGLTLTDLNNGTGIMFLFYGWGCVIWQPLALQYGKRPAYLLSLVANIIIMATAPLCTTSRTYQVSRVLLGLFGSPVESLCEISITDIWFTHERPKYMAWYGWSLALTGKLAPMISGFINTGMGWEWTLWWCAIFNGIAFIYCFLFMEETNYDRKHVDDSVPDAEEKSPNSVLKNINMTSTADAASADKSLDSKEISPASPSSDIEEAQVIKPRKTYWQKLSLRDKRRPNRVLDVALAPFKGFLYPPVVYAGLMWGANSLVWSGVQNATAGTVYTTKYGWSTTDVSGAYAAGVIGTITGGYYSGKVGRMLTLRLARRNNGVSEPEHILYLFVASMILVPFSLVLYGVGVVHHIHWFGLVFSQFLLANSNALCVSAALTYAISSYHELSGGMVVTCVLIRNTLSFAINYAITPWLEATGYQNTYVTVAVIGFVWNASLFGMVRWGRRMREATAQRYWRDVKRAREKGLSE
ncbi:major facilitator superfamily transporter [Diaporthe amygdali]|uniref:major facilitator superfamily transporter n=1 Tax=Phomopsis amygdali TaxID=1214568 RepID=UPI0022FF17C9|nr:major facilitator superfamily transporter [Diaporthe amygdali]KAJ0125333.1 major facilitator superfamily transporter [Diaporthe amygdali]